MYLNMSKIFERVCVITDQIPYLLLMDAYVMGQYDFLKEYAPKFTDDGVSIRAVATSEGQKMRGMLDPSYTTIHFAPNRDSLMKLFYTGN